MKGNQVPETTSSATDVLKAGNRVVALGIAAIVVILLGAAVLLVVIGALVWRLLATRDLALRPWAMALAGAMAWQVASGLSNVLLDWPLLAAVAHTGGAAVLLVVLAMLLTRSRPERAAAVHTAVPSGQSGIRAAS